MTELQKTRLIAKAIRCYAQEHYGWSAKYHPDDKEKWDILIQAANEIEKKHNEPVSIS